MNKKKVNKFSFMSNSWNNSVDSNHFLDLENKIIKFLEKKGIEIESPSIKKEEFYIKNRNRVYSLMSNNVI